MHLGTVKANPFGDRFAYNRARLELHAVSHGNMRQILNLIDEVSAVARLEKAKSAARWIRSRIAGLVCEVSR